jgi:hypothetical protein
VVVYMAWSKSMQPRAGKNKLTDLVCCSLNPLSELSPSDTTYLFQGSFHFPKPFWKRLFGIANSCVVMFHFISSLSWNLFSFNSIFISGNRRESHGGHIRGKGGAAALVGSGV